MGNIKSVEMCHRCHVRIDGRKEYESIDVYFSDMRSHEIVYCNRCANIMKEMVKNMMVEDVGDIDLKNKK